MARVSCTKPDKVDDPQIAELFEWITGVEGAVPNHFYVELNFPEYLIAKLGSTKVLWQMGELTLPEIQHVGILVSKANGCPYCTGAFCTILNYGLDTAEGYVKALAERGIDAVENSRLRSILEIALKANNDPKAITDEDIDRLKTLDLTDRGVIQLIHLVSDFASYNRLNQALKTDYDYRDIWRGAAFGWSPDSGEPAGDNSRGAR